MDQDVRVGQKLFDRDDDDVAILGRDTGGGVGGGLRQLEGQVRRTLAETVLHRSAQPRLGLREHDRQPSRAP